MENLAESSNIHVLLTVLVSSKSCQYVFCTLRSMFYVPSVALKDYLPFVRSQIYFWCSCLQHLLMFFLQSDVHTSSSLLVESANTKI